LIVILLSHLLAPQQLHETNLFFINSFLVLSAPLRIRATKLVFWFVRLFVTWFRFFAPSRLRERNLFFINSFLVFSLCASAALREIVALSFRRFVRKPETE